MCLVAAVAALSACEPPAGDPSSPEGGAEQLAPALVGDVRVRLMGANITSGNLQSYDPGEGIRIFQGTDPDVAMIQEFNYGTNSAADLRSFVDQAFGTTFSYCREAGAQIPNGVISRYPIIACFEWDDPRVSNRDFEVAKIDLPGPTNLWAISVHLLTTSTTERDLEAQALVSFIQSNVPAGDWVAIGGDFNTGSTTESCLSRLSSVVVTSAPRPADRNGNTMTNASRSKPYDWVLVSSGLNSKQTSTVIGASTFTSGLVADTRVYSPISEISPALSTDSGAVNMQHMGVIKDFMVPSDVAVTSVTVTSPNGGESWTAGSTHPITWSASGISNVKIEYTLDGASWTVAASSVSASAGSYSWVVPSTSTTAARVRVSDAAGSGVSDTSDGAFTIAPQSTPAAVFLNEVLANEPGSDVNGEFVEVVNSGGGAADLSGWTISDGTGIRHTFASGTSLGAGSAVVVFGGASAIPSGLTNAVAASTGALGLSNSGDSVILKNGSGAQVDAVTYSSSLASNDGVSMNRNPDGSSSGAWVLHTSLSTLLASPGKRADGTDFGGGSPPPPSSSISAETEPNDSNTTANGPIGNGKAVTGAISTSTDQDWYRIPVKSAGTLTISLSIGGAADLDWYLSTESAPTTVVARGYTSNNPETGSYAAAANTTYLLKVNGYLGATSGYTLTVTAPSATLDP